MRNRPIGIRVSENFFQLMKQCGEEHTGTVIALMAIGAAHSGLSIDDVHEDIGAALGANLNANVRAELMRVYTQGAANTEEPAPAAPSPPTAPAQKREKPEGNSETGDTPLEFRF